jgi:hypothetical protein
VMVKCQVDDRLLGWRKSAIEARKILMSDAERSNEHVLVSIRGIGGKFGGKRDREL